MAQTNYKCGISFGFSGTEGVDWAEEYFYHDRLINDARAVWIKSTTQISLTHNSLNLSRLDPTDPPHGLWLIGANGMDGIPNSGDEGAIRYQVDMDMAPKWRWVKNTGVNLLPAYSTPLTFATLQFPGTATNVLGATGPVPGQVITDMVNYYHRGILDGTGDEWHILTVADDDSANWNTANPVDSQFKASDGRVIPFVVDPKTPHLSIAATGDAQFYTRRPKVYAVPKIHEMVTYIAARTGSIAITLRALSGANVYWRIGGGAYTNGGASVVLTHTNFSSGTNTLEYYHDPSFVRSRTIIKNPASPSAGESPGNLFWKDAAGLDRIKAKFLRAPYLAAWNSFKSSESGLRQKPTEWDAVQGQGKRLGGGMVSGAEGSIGYAVNVAWPNALCALLLGWTAKRSGTSAKSYGQYAKEMLLENVRQIDPVGANLNYAAEAAPSPEITNRGYWDAQQVLDIVGALDILSANFREDQVTGGITPIEELKVRDDLAAFNVQCLQWMGGWRGANDAPGMWGGAMCICGLAASILLKDYSNPTFGTSGFNGSTTTYPNTPYPVTQKTWKQFFSTDDFTLGAYPEPMWRIGVTGNGGDSLVQNSVTFGNNNWIDKVDYMSTGQMGQWLSLLLNLGAMHTPSVSYSALAAMMLRCADGTLYGLKASSVPGVGNGPIYRGQLATYNRNFPAIAAAGIPTSKGLPSGDDSSEVKWMNDYRLESLLFYDDAAANPNVEDVVITPGAGTYESTRTVTLYCPTAGADIRYTTNGTTPSAGSTLYTAPISVPASATIKAIGIKSGSTDSAVTSEAFVIDTSGKPSPVLSQRILPA